MRQFHAPPKEYRDLIDHFIKAKRIARHGVFGHFRD
jgi:hypothetical protein